MSGLANALVIIAVIGLVLARQLKPRKVADGNRWWLLPAVLAFMALREPGLIDQGHRAEAIGLLCAELLVGVGMGAVWAWTSRMWTDKDGEVWVRGTKATAAAWLGCVVLRVGLYALAAVAGVHQDSGSLMLAIAATLLIRTGVVLRRAQSLRGQSLEPTYRTSS